MQQTRVTITLEIPPDSKPRGQIRFAGVLFYDRPGLAKCGRDAARDSVVPQATIEADGVAV